MPDLVLIDGGRGQLNAALAALARLGLEEMPVAALAKREEEVYRPGLPEPLRLPREDPGLQLLQRIRDETHRFALARHRARRGKRSLRSRLDDVPGIGPRRKRLLLERFGTVDRILEAGEAEVAAAVGPKLAARVRAALTSDPAQRNDLDSGRTSP